MSKAVMLSVRPEWCEKIVLGKKTVEIRKTRPRLEPPFKCYIYCTKAPKGWLNLGTGQQLDGKVIAEFTCDRIEKFDVPYPAFRSEMREDILKQSCVEYYPLHRYAYHDGLYAWHISDLKIYDKPKSITDFQIPSEKCDGTNWPWLHRPPQSWCYVEEVENHD